MREVPRDNKWNKDTDAGMDEQVQGLSDYADRAELLESQPSEEALLTISLLMRIYDVQMAILSTMDKELSDEVFEAHERGESFNPPVFIPEFKVE